MPTTNRRVWHLGALLLAVLCLPSRGNGQDLCQPTETIAKCWDRLTSERLKPVNGQEKKAQQETPRKTETGLADISGLSSSVKDFLPLLQMSGVLGAVQKDDQTGAVTVALNTPFVGSSRYGDDRDNALQVKAVIETTAKLFEPLKKKLPEKDRAALEKQLLGSNENADNVTLHASYNFSSRHLGRNFAQHSDALNALFDAATRGEVAAQEQAFLTAAGQIFQKLKSNISSTQWKDMSPADRRVIQEGLPGIVAAEIDATAAYAARLKAVGLDVYGQLVTNQPQLQITASRSFRDDLFGPDLVSGRISFEMGLGNSLNAALGPYNGTCAVKADECLATYAAFLKDPRIKAAIKEGSRFSIYVEVIKNEDYHFVSADPALDLAIAEGTGWTAGLDYGRLIAVDDTGTAGGRVDASLKWEAPADKTVDRRLVASLTITKKLGDISVPFGLVYANKPKYLTGVDQGLGAHIGLKFNLFPGLK
ncbi:MAG: hypothetical protein A3H96_20735 [Acidobacteria bacterium RIFCSPLOWO2_02_FULL_67_36]|nr:MAG: hypothetical protein A3H96_20735 [Acidobacteria bacterium RIFCSPLOWO2_02_FULL_67_36]OFW25477.1 MAG: hypothetical protein A3G21_19520 [Acidobacteria bacterium RIFCSPLOWO2_12_FULL_66_21]